MCVFRVIPKRHVFCRYSLILGIFFALSLNNYNNENAAKLLECLKSGVQIHCQHRISNVCESESLMLSRENRRLVSKLSDRADEMGKRLLLIGINCSLVPSSLMLLPKQTQEGRINAMKRLEVGSKGQEEVSVVTAKYDPLTTRSNSSDSDGDDSFGISGDWG